MVEDVDSFGLPEWMMVGRGSAVANSTQHKLAAILIANAAGRDWVSRIDEECTHRALSAYVNAITALIDRRDGKVMDSVGDAVLTDEAIQ